MRHLRSSRTRGLLAISATLALGLTACGDAGTDDTAQQTGDEASPTQAALPEGVFGEQCEELVVSAPAGDVTASPDATDSDTATDDGTSTDTDNGTDAGTEEQDVTGASDELRDLDLLEALDRVDELSEAADAIRAAGLETTLEDLEAFTVFVPTDDAFDERDADGTTTDTDTDTDTGTASGATGGTVGESTLRYHVTEDGELTAQDLADEEQVRTLLEEAEELTVTVEGETLTVEAAENSADVVCANIEVENAVVHVIDAVLDPGEAAGTEGDFEPIEPEDAAGDGVDTDVDTADGTETGTDTGTGTGTDTGTETETETETTDEG